MELLFALLIVAFFVVMNNVRVALTGADNQTSEVFMGFSSIVFGFLFALFV